MHTITGELYTIIYAARAFHVLGYWGDIVEFSKISLTSQLSPSLTAAELKTSAGRSTPVELFLFFSNTCAVRKILDWSATDYLTAAIESSIHLWSGHTQSVQHTINVAAVGGPGKPKTKTTVDCLKWDARGEKLAYSFTVEQDADSPSNTPRHGHDATDQSAPAGDMSWASADSAIVVSDEDALLTSRSRLNAFMSLDRSAETFPRDAFTERASYVKVRYS